MKMMKDLKKLVAYIFLLLLSTSPLHAQSYLELNNDTLKLKLDLSRGGAICYISNSSDDRNLVNIHDEGRYIQQSYYAGNTINRKKDGQKADWSPWSWNPIQVGDCYGNRARILEYKKVGNSLYVKCTPMLWDMKNAPAEAVMEQWTTLNGNIIRVHNKLTCHRTDTIYGEGVLNDQELPAVYPISALKNLYTYLGDKPFTGAKPKQLVVKHLEDDFWGRYKNDTIAESWMAFVDDKKWGMAVYSPLCKNFLAGMAGQPGFESNDGATSYIAPIKKVALNKNSVFEYDYYLIVGTLTEISEQVYQLNKTLK